MMNVPENELFSAYLDGELTGADQAKVEQILATSPAARQLLDELRALSVSLQSLPRERLKEDLSERVLRQAERRMLGDGRARPAATDSEPRRRGGALGRVFRPRNFVWSAIAVSVALVLMVREQAPAPRPAVDAVAVAPEVEPVKEPPSIQAIVEPEAEPETTIVVQDGLAAESPASPMAEGADASPTPAAPPQPETPPAAAVASDAEPGAPSHATEAEVAPPAAAVASSAAAPMDKPEPSPEAPVEPAKVAASAETGPTAPEAAAEEKEPPEVLVVRCDVDPDLLKEGVFDQILSNRKIALIDPETPPDGETGPSKEGADSRTYRIETTGPQFVALMQDLKKRPDDFRGLKTTVNQTANGSRQQSIRIGGGKVRIGSARVGGGGMGIDTSTGAVGAGAPRGVGGSSVRLKFGVKATVKAPDGKGKAGETESKAKAPENAQTAKPKPAAKVPQKIRVRFVFEVAPGAKDR